MVSAPRGVRLRAVPDVIELTPGEPTTLLMEVFNTTGLVDQFDLTAVGIDPGWVRFNPPRLSLFPSSAATASTMRSAASPARARTWSTRRTRSP